MPGRFDRFQERSEWTDPGAPNRSNAWPRLKSYAVRHPIPGSVLQGLAFGAVVTLLVVLKNLPGGEDIERDVLIGAAGGGFFALCMTPFNVRSHRRLVHEIQARSGDLAEDATEHS